MVGQEERGQRWPARYRLLVETLTRCGVDLSDDDEAAVEFIARSESGTVRTVISWILRVRSAGRDATTGVTLPDLPGGST